jgi:hypothetical protein
MKRYVTAVLMAWMLFIGVDFLFHASIFASLWKEDIATFKSLENLALLIPIGYLSFLLLTILVAYVFFKIHNRKPTMKQVVTFSLIFGSLYSLSNLLGSYSYIEIPLKHLLLFNLVYFIEIIVVSFTLYLVMYTNKFKKTIWLSIITFFALVMVGVVIQNILDNIL